MPETSAQSLIRTHSYADCNSAPHRSVLGLYAVALGARVTGQILGSEAVRADNAGARRWARRALKNFGQPDQYRWKVKVRWAAGFIVRFVTNPASRRRYLKIIFSRSERAQVLEAHRERYRRMK